MSKTPGAPTKTYPPSKLVIEASMFPTLTDSAEIEAQRARATAAQVRKTQQFAQMNVLAALSDVTTAADMAPVSPVSVLRATASTIAAVATTGEAGRGSSLTDGLEMHSGIDTIVANRLASSEIIASDLLKQVASLTRAKDNLTENIRQKQAQLEECETNLAAKQAESNACASQLQTAGQNIAKTESNLQIANEALTKIQQEKTSTETELNGKIERLNNAKTQQDALHVATLAEQQETIKNLSSQAIQNKKTVLENAQAIEHQQTEKTNLDEQLQEQKTILETANSSAAKQTQTLVAQAAVAKREHDAASAAIAQKIKRVVEETAALNSQIGIMQGQFQGLQDSQLRHLEWILLHYLLSSQAFWKNVSTSGMLQMTKRKTADPSTLYAQTDAIITAARNAISTTQLETAVSIMPDALTKTVAQILHALRVYISNTELYTSAFANATKNDNDVTAYMSAVNDVIHNFKFVPFLVYFNLATLGTPQATGLLPQLIRYTEPAPETYAVA